MNKKVYVSVVGTSSVDGVKDETELVTEGEYLSRNGKYFLRYREQLSDDERECSTIIKIDKSTVIMTRTGGSNTQMIFESGKRHMGHYETPLGSFTVGVSTDVMEVCVDDNGGRVEINYVLDINSIAQIENHLLLNIRSEYSA